MTSEGRCLDLERAYRQVPVLESNLRFSVIAVPHPALGQPKYFLSNSPSLGSEADQTDCSHQPTGGGGGPGVVEFSSA